MENNKLWYALQHDNNDDWGTGFFDKEKAIEELKNNDYYNLIAVIENDTECIEEIYKSDL